MVNTSCPLVPFIFVGGADRLPDAPKVAFPGHTVLLGCSVSSEAECKKSGALSRVLQTAVISWRRIDAYRNFPSSQVSQPMPVQTVGLLDFPQLSGGSALYAHYWVRQGVLGANLQTTGFAAQLRLEWVAGPLFSPLCSPDSSPMPHHTTKSRPVFPNSGSSEKSWSRPTVLHAAGIGGLAENATRELQTRLFDFLIDL